MDKTTQNKKVNTVAVLDKAITIITFLESAKGGIGLTEIAKQTKINKATCYRILQTLMVDRIVEYGDIAGTYQLGLRLLELGNIVKRRLDIRKIALPFLKELTGETKDTSYLCLLNNFQSLCVERVEGTYARVLLLNVGDIWPLYVGAAARAMLAYIDDDEINKIIHPPQDNHIIQSNNKDINYWDLIHEVRKNGYSVSYEDVVAGVSSIGAPIFDSSGKVVASISLSSTSKKLLDNKEEVAQLIMHTANQISKSLGCVVE
ncbi:IclR family transcriptional regulator [Pseudogracilibacillus auburnensis]|uniref:IclR family transcriptional regulator n=1 Tax=Pseudogracilibacillus auburnensis TaxID=1494959 RepID=UPI001A9617D7|nr:IclR family transcriptional regulator [Pseudogracilibacillus auburnensis]MBO1003252.1 IclR family transcriptional regulator [Pseudogracilibacillus auburnensis]